MKPSMQYFGNIIRSFMLAATVASLLPAVNVEARKKGYRLTVEKQTRAEKEEQKMSKGSFMVASECNDCNNGYRINQIVFSGYDKPLRSSKETFFITNNTDRTMSGVTLYITYLMPDGRQLNKRFVRLSCNIPPGETRIADIESWDKQKSFYYEKSDAGKKGGTPYTVAFDPIAFYLRF